MSTGIWKLEKDLCRCCHDEGKFHSLSEPVHNLGQTELYLDMLNCSFGIDIRSMEGALSTMTFTICQPCILRLRDASNFKRQVLLCEERFKDMYDNFIKALSPEVKEELPEKSDDDIKEEYLQSDDNKDIDEKSDDSECNQPILKKILISTTPRVKSKLQKKPKVKSKKAQSKKAVEVDGKGAGDETKHKKGEQRPCKFVLRQADYRTDGEDMFCSFCDRKYTKLSSLRFHVKSKHYKVNRFFCKICDKGFLTPAPLTVHKLQEHNVDDRLKCKACEAVFNTNVQLRKHINNFHLLGQKHKCQSCDYESFSFESLYKHKFKHKTVKDYHCKFCRKSFLRKATLDLHERIHTGDRRKVCSVCSQAFVQKASLNYHMTKYHPEVNF